MFFRQFIDPDLGCASYLLGDGDRAVVVDPGLDTEQYVVAAAGCSARITLVLETHVHADHVSGRDLLAARTGAAVRLPAGAGAHADAADVPLVDGDRITVGSLELTVLATPGHRPEHVAFAVADRSRSDEPWMLLAGDSLLVGDLARPDLAVEPAQGASDLHASIRRLLALGDGLQVWPGHVGGSLCGGASLSHHTSSTIGFERATNPLLGIDDVPEFTDRIIAATPVRPPTVERVVARNRRRRPTEPVAPAILDDDALASALDIGAVVVDGRSLAAFDAGHVPGALSLPLTGRGVGTRLGWVVDGETPLVARADGEASARELARRLRAVALDRVVGLVVEAPSAERGRADAITLAHVPALLGERELVDVRGTGEWRDGHVPGSHHVPLEALAAGADALRRRPLMVACAVGGRAAFAASWLRRHGFDALRVAGGGVPGLPALGVALEVGA